MARNTDIVCGLCTKWTTELPYEGISRRSSNICIRQISDWFLELSLSYKTYYLHLRNESDKKLEKPITVTTFIQDTEQCTELFLGNVVTVDNSKSVGLLWEGFQWDVSKKISNILSVGKFTLTCLFNDSSESAAKFQSKASHVSTQTDFISSTFSRDLPSLSRDFSNFVEDETFTDVTLKCGDCTFSAHKSVLAARSEVFAAMFRNKMAESETGVVDVQDLDPDVLQPLLKYMYSGEKPDVCQGSARRLYEAADKYAVYALKQACSECMVSDMTQQNCLDLLVLADEHSDEDFKDAASCFVADHLHLLGKEAWSAFKKQHLELAVAVFEKRSADALSGQT